MRILTGGRKYRAVDNGAFPLLPQLPSVRSQVSRNGPHKLGPRNQGILRAFHEAGRDIPGDVSVVGFDDVPEAEYQMVPLTTVAVDAKGAAQRILAELLRMIEGAEPPAEAIKLPGTKLIIRRSSGPAPRPYR